MIFTDVKKINFIIPLFFIIFFIQLRRELQQVYHKLWRLKNELNNEITDDEVELHLISGDIVTKLVDEVIELIHERTMSLGLMGAVDQVSSCFGHFCYIKYISERLL